MRILTTTLLLLIGFMAYGQDNVVPKVDSNFSYIADSLSIQLTDLQKQRIASIDQRKRELKQQYDQAVKQLDQAYYDFLTVIADANHVPAELNTVDAKPDKLIFRKEKQ